VDPNFHKQTIAITCMASAPAPPKHPIAKPSPQPTHTIYLFIFAFYKFETCFSSIFVGKISF